MNTCDLEETKFTALLTFMSSNLDDWRADGGNWCSNGPLRCWNNGSRYLIRVAFHDIYNVEIAEGDVKSPTAQRIDAVSERALELRKLREDQRACQEIQDSLFPPRSRPWWKFWG